MPYTLELTQKLTLMKNVWTLARVDGEVVPLGRIEQARLRLREHVECQRADGAGPWFTVRARSAIELVATYDITDGQGASLGTMTKDVAASFGRSTYRVETPAGRWVVTETSAVKAIARRLVGLLTDVPWLFRVQFSVLDANGRPVGHVNRKDRRLIDTYEIRSEDDALDQRVAAAIGVAVDAFMNR